VFRVTIEQTSSRNLFSRIKSHLKETESVFILARYELSYAFLSARCYT